MEDALTIDNYNVEIHERYATDRETLDPFFTQEAHNFPIHSSEVAASKTSIKERWEELLEADDHRHPFAQFSPPPNYALMRNRFFSSAISTQFNWSKKGEKAGRKHADDYKKKVENQGSGNTPLALFEKETHALTRLIEQIATLNKFLSEIDAGKLLKKG